MRPVLVLAVVLTAGCQSQMSPQDLCAQTVRDYAVLRDEGPVDDYLALFTEDGRFELGGTVTRGNDELAARHKGANADKIWRHNMGHIHITDDLKGISRVTVHVGPRGQEVSSPVREIHADYYDVFEIENGRCRIKSRKVNIIFDRKL